MKLKLKMIVWSAALSLSILTQSAMAAPLPKGVQQVAAQHSAKFYLMKQGITENLKASEEEKNAAIQNLIKTSVEEVLELFPTLKDDESIQSELKSYFSNLTTNLSKDNLCEIAKTSPEFSALRASCKALLPASASAQIKATQDASGENRNTDIVLPNDVWRTIKSYFPEFSSLRGTCKTLRPVSPQSQVKITSALLIADLIERSAQELQGLEKELAQLKDKQATERAEIVTKKRNLFENDEREMGQKFAQQRFELAKVINSKKEYMSSITEQLKKYNDRLYQNYKAKMRTLTDTKSETIPSSQLWPKTTKPTRHIHKMPIAAIMRTYIQTDETNPNKPIHYIFLDKVPSQPLKIAIYEVQSKDKPYGLGSIKKKNQIPVNENAYSYDPKLNAVIIHSNDIISGAGLKRVSALDMKLVDAYELEFETSKLHQEIKDKPLFPESEQNGPHTYYEEVRNKISPAFQNIEMGRGFDRTVPLKRNPNLYNEVEEWPAKN